MTNELVAPPGRQGPGELPAGALAALDLLLAKAELAAHLECERPVLDSHGVGDDATVAKAMEQLPQDVGAFARVELHTPVDFERGTKTLDLVFENVDRV